MTTKPAAPRLRRLAAEDLAAIVELQRAVCAGSAARFIAPKDEAELARFLDGTLGAAYGVAEAASVVATALLRLPGAGPSAPSLKEALASPGVVMASGLPERIAEGDWARRTAFLENAMVLSAARGRGYQRALLDARLAHVRRAGMRWVFAGVNFWNTISWSNLLRRGLAIGGIRFDRAEPILGMLHALDAAALASAAGDRISVKYDDVSEHRAALERGYVGVLAGARGDVIYQRLSPAPARGSAQFPEPGHPG